MDDVLFDLDPEAIDFYAALGRFVHGFSMTEQTLHLYLWEISGIPVGTLQALVTEQRFSTVKDAIKRLFDSRAEQPPPMYARAVEQLGKINSLRNDIVHLGRVLTTGGLLVSTWERVIPQKAKEYRVTGVTLADATADVTTARIALSYLMSPDERLLEYALAPWRYKPVPPNQSG